MNTADERISTLCREGESLYRQNRRDEAAQRFEGVLAIDASNFVALGGLGLIAFDRAQYSSAVEWYEKAAKARPNHAGIYSNLGDALARNGRMEDAIGAYDAALRLEPAYAGALAKRSTAQLNVGRLDEAVDGYRKLLEKAPDQPTVLFNYAVARIRQREFRDAASALSRLVRLSPTALEPMAMLLSIFKQLNAYEEAAPFVRDSVTMASAALAQVGQSANDDAFTEARRQALAHQLLLLGSSLLELNEPQRALELFEQGLARLPQAPELHFGRGNAMVELMNHDEALKSFDSALALRPTMSEAHANRGIVLFQQGNFDRALESYDTALSMSPEPGRILSNLVHAKKFTSEDDRHLLAIRNLLASAQAADGDAMCAHFAAGKAYDDLARYREALPHFLEGNRLKRQTIDYDRSRDEALFEAVKTCFDPDFVARNEGRGFAGEAPIFVFGIPRSGTTLVEQMIATHPEVSAIGESGFFGRAIAEALRERNMAAQYFAALREISPRQLDDLGRRFVAKASARAKSPRVVEKTTINFQHAALISAALPDAVLIHVRRDPLDTCFSCFSTLFMNGVDYSYDLEDLGSYYLQYAALMRHWAAVLPPGRILHVDYESLVSNFDDEAGKILAFCGLTPTATVRDFGRANRAIRTASAYQIRQGLYGSSIGRWRHYRDGLSVLERALAPEIRGKEG